MKLGELAKNDNFQLCEAMSAIELMDPKMDIGMIAFDESIRFESLIQSGRLNVKNMDLKEMIATMDAIFAAFMSWLDGNSIAQTLLTCVCLHDVSAIEDPILSSFCYGILDLSSTFKYIIQTAAVYEEEDFNGYFSSEIKTLPVSQTLNHLKNAENDLQRKLRHKEENSELLEAILHRTSFVRFLILSLCAVVPPAINVSDGNIQSSPVFKPNLDDCATYLRSASCLLAKIEATISYGLNAPDNNNDGDFAWLPSFEPEVNRRCLPATFPRKTQMLNRLQGINSFQKLISKIFDIAIQLPNHIANIESILLYLRSFSVSESCVLSRSLLQLICLPIDDRIMARIHLSDLINESLRLFAAPLIFDQTCAISSDKHCRTLWDEFVSDAVKVFLGIIQMFGLNLARQREKIICCIEDFSALQNEAERVGSEFDAFLTLYASSSSSSSSSSSLLVSPLALSSLSLSSSSTASASSKSSSQSQSQSHSTTITTISLTSFVLYHTLLLIDYHFYLSFRLDLFAPFEYPYVYWYMSEVIFKCLLNAIDRSNTLIVSDYNRAVKEKKRKKNLKSKKDMELRKRISDGQRSLFFYRAQAAHAEALFKLSIGLISIGKIRLPVGGSDAERLRFEHRMSPFLSLSPPLLLNYYQFTQMSRIAALLMLGSSKCFMQAAEAFEMARSQLEKLDTLMGSSPVGSSSSTSTYAYGYGYGYGYDYSSSNSSSFSTAAIARICKRNAVVARILSTGNKIDSEIKFVFTKDSVVFPLLKIS